MESTLEPAGFSHAEFQTKSFIGYCTQKEKIALSTAYLYLDTYRKIILPKLEAEQMEDQEDEGASTTEE